MSGNQLHELLDDDQDGLNFDDSGDSSLKALAAELKYVNSDREIASLYSVNFHRGKLEILMHPEVVIVSGISIDINNQLTRHQGTLVTDIRPAIERLQNEHEPGDLSYYSEPAADSYPITEFDLPSDDTTILVISTQSPDGRYNFLGFKRVGRDVLPIDEHPTLELLRNLRNMGDVDNTKLVRLAAAYAVEHTEKIRSLFERKHYENTRRTIEQSVIASLSAKTWDLVQLALPEGLRQRFTENIETMMAEVKDEYLNAPSFPNESPGVVRNPARFIIKKTSELPEKAVFFGLVMDRLIDGGNITPIFDERVMKILENYVDSQVFPDVPRFEMVDGRGTLKTIAYALAGAALQYLPTILDPDLPKEVRTGMAGIFALSGAKRLISSVYVRTWGIANRIIENDGEFISDVSRKKHQEKKKNS